MSVITYQYSRLQRFQERVSAMIADPDCDGDLLLVGIAIAHHWLLHPKGHDGTTWRSMSEPLLGSRRYWDSGYVVKGILRDDIRRYDMRADPANDVWGRVPCAAPMQRREGLCGKPSKISGGEVQFDTGEVRMIGACSRADHQQWYKEHRRYHHEERQRRIIPRPYANTGGVLARHFPNIDWEHLYVEIDPKWEAPPERDPSEVAAPEANEPRFKLILGDDEGDSGDGSRVRLQVLGDQSLWSDQ